jgi:hypothetical protein
VPRATGGTGWWWVDVEIDVEPRRILVQAPTAVVAAASIEGAWREGGVREYGSDTGHVLVTWRQVATLRVCSAAPVPLTHRR